MISNQNQNHTVANDFKSKSFKIDLQNQNHTEAMKHPRIVIVIDRLIIYQSAQSFILIRFQHFGKMSITPDWIKIFAPNFM